MEGKAKKCLFGGVIRANDCNKHLKIPDGLREDDGDVLHIVVR